MRDKFLEACRDGDLAELENLLNLQPLISATEFQKIDDYEGFIEILENADIKAVKFLWDYFPSNIKQQMIERKCYRLLVVASTNSNPEILKFLWEQSDQNTRTNIIEAQDYAAFRWACGNRYLEAVKFLWEQTDQNTHSNMIKAQDYEAFRLACGNGYLEAVEFLWEQTDQNTHSNIIEAQDYAAFRWACESGHLEVVKFIWERCDKNNLNKMTECATYFAFRKACELDSLDIAKFLWENCPDDLRQNMLGANNFEAFENNLSKKNWHVLDWLLSKCNAETLKNLNEKFPDNKLSSDLILQRQQRQQILEQSPNFEIDQYNFKLTHLVLNPTLAKLMMSCKNLPEDLKPTLQNTDILAETSNFIIGKKHFCSEILDLVRTSQSIIFVEKTNAINSIDFFLNARKSRFGLQDDEKKEEGKNR